MHNQRSGPLYDVASNERYRLLISNSLGPSKCLRCLLFHALHRTNSVVVFLRGNMIRNR